MLLQRIAILFTRTSVVRPFVKPVFPERVKQINAKFGEKVGYIFTISPDKFCLLFKILHFDFYDVHVVTFCHRAV